MKDFEKLKTTKEKVELILRTRVDSRDNDNLLVALFWYAEEKNNPNPSTSSLDFLRNLAAGKYTSAESIRRVRQKIQENDSTLRGSNYKEKKTTIERKVRENIKNL